MNDMRVFVTGASGFIGSAIVQELLSAGHEVLGLARSDESASMIQKNGAQVHRGDLEDLESLRKGASTADGVIHTGFNHDFSKFAANCEADRKAIEALGAELSGSERPLIITSGTGHNASNRIRTEEDPLVPSSINPRGASEEAAEAVAANGGRVSVIRLPQVHDPFKQGLITYLIAIARQKGVSAYVGDGLNRWPAVPRLDAARLYKLALEKGTPGARYHAVAEEGVPLKEIAESIGRGLKIPVVSKTAEEAAAHFGWLAFFTGSDLPASSAITREKLGWRPVGAGLISDLDQARY
jgi:nucleoside-diphosphate-sugar epimerase